MKKLLSIILAILMIVTTIPMAALPASAALTPTATGGCNGNHSGYTQIQLNGGTTHRITKAGNYYLNSSIYESTYSPALEIECSGTVTICLNGYDICHTGYGSRVVYLSSNDGELTVNLCDCKGSGEIYHEDGNTGIDFTSGVITLNMYGGTIRDCDIGMSTWMNSTVNMYGGTIKNCSYYGIFQSSYNGKVNIYGGSIINNNEGIRVCSADSVTLTGSPVISGNTKGDLYYRLKDSAVITKDLSVSSPITIGQDSSASGDYAVVKVDSADMLGSFKYINNTKKLFYNNNQIFVHGDSHSFKDATCAAPKTCTICGATEGVADNTAHIWGEGVLTRPTKTEEGYYTYTCSACGDTKTEAAQRAANYAEYTKALNDLRAYLDSDKLTDDVKASVAEWLEIYDSDEAYKFIAGEEETVNLYIEAALYYAAEIEAAIQDCLAGNHSGNGEYCDICGVTLHTCDFTGEWKYDSEKHWKECTCGETSEEAEHTYTDSKCDCGYECPHEKYTDGVCDVCGYECAHKWGDGALVRPTRTEEGYLLYTCSICNDTKTEPVERPANYAEFKELLEKVKGYLDENLTDSMLQEVNNVINFFELDANHRFIKGEENTVSQMIRQISGFIEVVEEGIADGTAVKANYTHIDEVIKHIEEKFADEYLTDERKAELEQIKSDIEKLKADPDTSAADLEGLERSVYNIFTAAEACFNGYHRGLRYELTEEAKCGKNAVESATCSSCGKVLTREVENTALTHSFTKYEEVEAPKCGVAGKEVAYCDNGCGEIEVRATEALKHIPLDAVKENEVDPECEKEGSYDLVVYCDLCGGEISRETFAVDALEHLFLDYIYNEDATCTADGTKTAECIYGCGETDTVTAEDTMLDHADEDGDKICDGCETEIKDVCPDCGGTPHEGEYGEYICMLITLIKLVVSLVKALQSLQTVA